MGLYLIELFYQRLQYMGICGMHKSTEPAFFVPIRAHKQWESSIAPQLEELAKGTLSSSKVIDTLIYFNQKYCWRRREMREDRGKRKIEYWALQKLYGEKLPTICKLFASALLQLKTDPIPLVIGQKASTFNYRKKDFIYLLLLMFFSLVPKQQTDGVQYWQRRFNNSNNFYHILTNNLFKTQCIVEYLLIILTQLTEQREEELLTIVRNFEPDKNIEEIILMNKEKPMGKLTLQSNNKSIQQYNGQIKIDFANRFIGGGCLRDGCVQQEIMFAIRPQLYATTLLCQKMEDNEALAFIGFKRYFDYSGYASSTKFEGHAKVEYKKTKDFQAAEYIAAIDAIKFKPGGKEQYVKNLIDREILKAYVGFSALPMEGKIITGGWGCGVYNGDIQTKLLIQWIAASLADKQMVFCPFGKKYLLQQHNFLEIIKNQTVQKVYYLLLEACQTKSYYKNQTLYRIAVDKFAKM